MVDQEIKDLEFEVKEGEQLRICLASFSSFPDRKINVKVHNNGNLQAYFVDFSTESGILHFNIELLEEGADATFEGAVLCGEESNKKIDVSLEHKAAHTTGLVSNHGIVKNKARLSFLGTSTLRQGCLASATRQEAKIIVFDPESDGKCEPILQIEESDITASHAATVGKLNDEHLFYLLSRGLNEEEAKKLIILGYLKPIVEHFPAELGERLLSAMEGGVAR